MRLKPLLILNPRSKTHLYVPYKSLIPICSLMKNTSRKEHFLNKTFSKRKKHYISEAIYTFHLEIVK